MGRDKSRDGKGIERGGDNGMRKIIIEILKFYKRYISRGEHCRFVPSCSVYAAQAVKKYGVIKGLWLGIKRVTRCNRWNKGGVDLLK